MKKLRLLPVFILGLFLMSVNANAQQGKIEIGLNSQLQLTKGKYFLTTNNLLEKKFKSGFGIGAEASYYLTDQFSVGIEANFNSIKKYKKIKDTQFQPRSFSMLFKPRFFILKDKIVRPYVEAGIGFTRMKLDVKNNSDIQGLPKSDMNKTKFVFAPGAGVRVAISELVDINAGLRYNVVKDFGHLQAQLGLAFKL
ncbi:porin family protein [Prolixibacteraceae bacterium JC049]|nr:porin family protein [Prolixibacteraceae bacterium JC049]